MTDVIKGVLLLISALLAPFAIMIIYFWFVLMFLLRSDFFFGEILGYFFMLLAPIALGSVFTFLGIRKLTAKNRWAVVAAILMGCLWIIIIRSYYWSYFLYVIASTMGFSA